MNRRLVGSLSVLVVVLAVGTVGYHLIEGFPLLDCMYMTVITLATVGFREVGPLTDAGKVFTIGLILVGVGTVGYTFTQVATFIIGGDLKRVMRGKQMEKSIQRIRDHVIVCGCGRVGEAVAAALVEAGERVVVIDRELTERMEAYPYLIGDATEDRMLEAAGIDRARALAACLASDADNLFVALSARTIRPDLKIVARAVSGDSVAKFRRAGADEVISVHDISARRMAAVLTRPHLVNLVDIMSSDREMLLEMSEVAVPSDGPWAGQTISGLNLKRQTGALILAVRNRDGRLLFNPDSDYRLRDDDVLIIMGEPEQVQRAEALLDGGRKGEG